MTGKFELGTCAVSRGVHAQIPREEVILAIRRHHSGDWGELEFKEDGPANEQALKDGSRIFSAYNAKDGTRFYVLTEAIGDDGHRSYTTAILPEEY